MESHMDAMGNRLVAITENADKVIREKLTT